MGMRGKVLKVKLGYNPNSSSIGSLFSAFLWIGSAGAFLLAMFSDLRPSGDGRQEAGAEPPAET